MSTHKAVFPPTAQARRWWYIWCQSTCSQPVGGKGEDEREKWEVTLHIKLPFIESKQQHHSVYLLTCENFLCYTELLNNLRKVLTNCIDSKCHRILNVSSAIILIALFNYLWEDVQLRWTFSCKHQNLLPSRFSHTRGLPWCTVWEDIGWRLKQVLQVNKHKQKIENC